MTKRFSSLKRLFLGLAVVATFAFAPSAGAWGTPYMTDAGSSYWTVRANGYNFSSGGWVYVETLDGVTQQVVDSKWIQASSGGCYMFWCYFGGYWSYYAAPNDQCGPGRDVWAYDWGTAANGYGWVGPLHTGCS